MEPDDQNPKPRWSRSQRFQLSSTGQEAQTSYGEMIVQSRATAGRQSLDAARVAWATRLALDSNDGLYLSELHEGPRTILELAAALDGCGPSREDVRVAVERLVRIRMVNLVVPPEPRPARRW